MRRTALWLVGFVALAFVVALCGCGGHGTGPAEQTAKKPPPEPPPEPTPCLLVFTDSGATRQTSSEWHLYVANTDLTDRRVVPNPSITQAVAPKWNQDGTRITFEQGFRIYAVNPDGTGLTQISGLDPATAGEDGRPDWCPDLGVGKIVFWRGAAPQMCNGLWVVDPDGANEERILPLLGHGAMSIFATPDWSPDGSHIYYYEYTYAGALADDDGTYRIPYPNEIDENGYSVIPPEFIAQKRICPLVSPDGSRLVYDMGGDIGTGEIRCVQLVDGVPLQPIEAHEWTVVTGPYRLYPRTWSRDPAQPNTIIYETRVDVKKGRESHLFSVDVTGGEPMDLGKGRWGDWSVVQ